MPLSSHTWILQTGKLPKYLLFQRSTHLPMINSSRSVDEPHVVVNYSFKFSGSNKGAFGVLLNDLSCFFCLNWCSVIKSEVAKKSLCFYLSYMIHHDWYFYYVFTTKIKGLKEGDKLLHDSWKMCGLVLTLKWKNIHIHSKSQL